MPRSALAGFHPLVAQWFRETIGTPSAPQQQGWPAIASGDDTLILAPTGSGKTLAAFLWELDQLIVRGLEVPLPNAVQILYISPLKALNNDIQRNLERPLAELARRFEEAGEVFPEIRVAVRTGDTPAAARARMLRRTPHILITTPESLHIMLTSTRARGMFHDVRAVIIDEIHALAGTKRGAHLALTLERAGRLAAEPPQRIGLSATQRPLDEIARFLSGGPAAAAASRIVDCGLVKQMVTTVESPVPDLNHIPAGTIWPAVTPVVLEHLRSARTTLVFVNNRAQAERMAGRLNTLAGEEVALPYHGSLSRERRLLLEGRLKAGELRALVSTSSLELGIDIGSIDLVVQVQSPKRVANALQRVGRAGHSLDAVSRGVVIPTFRDDAMEAVVLAGAMRAGDVEPTRVVQNALDVLAQVIVAMVSIDEDWTRDRLYGFVRQSYPYHALTAQAFDEVLEMLSGKYPMHLAVELDARITWDRTTGALGAPRGSRLMAVTSGGTIPDRGLYTVHLPDRTRIGELDEEFVHETRISDVFQLGSSTWRVQAIEHDRVIVVPAPGAPARMPFWHGEYGARSPHLTDRMTALRRELDGVQSDADSTALQEKYAADQATIDSLVRYVREQRAATGVVPDGDRLVVEQFRDETDSLRVVIHAPYGGRVNAPWGMALAHRVREWLKATSASPLFEIQVQTTDDGIMLRLPSIEGTLPLHVIRDLSPADAESRVLEEVGSSSLFGARFRMNAARALLLPRGNPRRRMPLWLQRLKALDLLQAVRQYPSFPILVETYRDVLSDAFAMDALADVLTRVSGGEILLHEAVTRAPSPFAASLQFGFVMDWMYGDDAPRAEQRAALLSLDRALLDEVLGAGAIDEETLAELDALLARRRGTAERSRARTADELMVLLDRAGDLTIQELEARVAAPNAGRIGDPLAELLTGPRVTRLDIPAAADAAPRLVLTEAVHRYEDAFGDDIAPRVRSAARREILARYLALSGPVAVEDIQARYAFPAAWIERRLDAWARSGTLVRGVMGDDPRTRWAVRRLVDQARRRELARARRAIQATDLAAFARLLARWQHLHPATRLEGEEGTATVARQFAGLARPADWWDRDAFLGRVDDRARESMSRLLAGGELAWVAMAADEPGSSRVGPVRIFARGTGRLWIAPRAEEPALSGRATAVRAFLGGNGASFFDEIAGGTGLDARRLRDALRELVTAGLVTSDSMEALRFVARWRVVPPPAAAGEPDPTRWLPAGFQPRPVVQRRPNLRRLPKWRRPDLEPAEPERWPGRWALATSWGILGPAREEPELAAAIAEQWIARYGVVSREMWRRERPPVPWRAIYREFRRLEMRGDVRRGQFVEGLTGAQFAHPAAVELLRTAAEEAAPVIVMAAGDPANPYALPLKPEARDPFLRRGGGSALIATINGMPVLSTDRRGSSMRVREGTAAHDVTRAVAALLDALAQRMRKTRDIVIESIDGRPAATSPWSEAFIAAGVRRATRTLRWYHTH